MSRALVGAVERGRHMPAADAAIRLAAALGSSVERLFGEREDSAGLPARPVVGDRLPEGALVRAARLDGRCSSGRSTRRARSAAPAPAADGVVAGGAVRLFPGAGPTGRWSPAATRC